ncbi:hypothetical protein [Legionella impletisoli]|uniref:Alpha/beta hydrolase family protein n=1 Tax=Legionella impletisoli TaxID=343510 RepID=A0A917N838_9GAMM|nr:hypothetical protein [Legionella impletisoli]GGI76606.1 hypothetical protein GCM10007966_01730 [Legionella impletisoli]
MKSARLCLIIALSFFFVTRCLAHNSFAIEDQNGPYEVDTEEYRLPAKIHTDVLNDEKTEIWARVFFPKNIEQLSPSPLVIMLHGNHSTCGRGKNPRIDDDTSYTITGECPKGYVVVPNHEGYNYIAKQLASWGIITISINSNRGINGGKSSPDDVALIKARGRLILKHLSLLYKWFAANSFPRKLNPKLKPIVNKMDFTRVGLFGHSRGAQGIRAAYALYQEPGSAWKTLMPELSINALYEIGGTDFPIFNSYTHMLDQLNADQVAWNQLLPLCDGDVVDAQGKNPFERMINDDSIIDNTPKSLYEVWGANHNFFNTEWQIPDVRFEICSHSDILFSPFDKDSKRQQLIAQNSVLAFFKGHLLNRKEDMAHFNPLSPLPIILKQITQIDRDYFPSRNNHSIAVVDNFNQNTGINSSGFSNVHHHIKIIHGEVDPSLKVKQRVAKIQWERVMNTPYFESVWSAIGQGKDISSFMTLDFRVMRSDSILNRANETDLSIHLVDADEKISTPVKLSEFSILNGPGSYDDEYQFNPLFRTVRIPLSQFQGVDLRKIHSVRFSFDQTESGAIYLTTIRFNKDYGPGFDTTKEMPHRIPSFHKSANDARVSHSLIVPEKLNQIKVVQLNQPKQAHTNEEFVEIHLESQEKFIVSDALPILRIGKMEFMLSRYSDSGDQHKLIFTIPKEQYEQFSGLESVVVSNGKTWHFGKLIKADVKWSRSNKR